MSQPSSPLRLIIVTQTFLLFAIVFMPALIRYLNQPVGKLLYGLLAAGCILLALFLRRSFAQLER